MTYVYDTKYYSIGLIVDDNEVVGLATDLKVSLTSDGTIDEFADKYKEYVDIHGDAVIFEETFPHLSSS